MKTALISGITGQDGSYLAELLLEKGYKVFGLVRPSTLNWFDRPNLREVWRDVTPVFGDVTDFASLVSALDISHPDEVYNLAAQSRVRASFACPEITHDVNGYGVVNLLTAMHVTDPQARFYQASTGEMFGEVRESHQTEETPFNPLSPYAVAKVYAHRKVAEYRDCGMFACNGILFNHESPRRGSEFVTRKITLAIARIMNGQQDVLSLGNLDAERDWGHAKDYVRAMWLMLQRDKPDDFVIATGKKHTVRQFVETAFGICGKRIEWVRPDIPDPTLEAGIVDGVQRVRVDPKFFRPVEVHSLCGFPEKAERLLGWRAEIQFHELVRDMVYADMVRVGGERRSLQGS